MKWFFACFLCFVFSQGNAACYEILMWHSLAEHLGTTLEGIVESFNKSQADYCIKPIYKGEYSETLTSLAAAFRAKKTPALVQIFEAGTQFMLHPRGIIKPLHELMQAQSLPLPESSFFNVVHASYSENGQLMAMPLNSSIPIFYYNADVLNKLGYKEKNFPSTWQKMDELIVQLKKEGFNCAYTSAYPAWIHIEAFAALHGLALYDQKGTHALYNNAPILRHLTRLKRWQDQHSLIYAGPTNDATALFTSGKCPLFTQSSGSFNSLIHLVPFRLGVAPLPLDSETSVKRHPGVVGGAALWALANQSDETYRGIALFFTFLARQDIQQSWYDATGYLPLGITGIYQDAFNAHDTGLLKLAKEDLMQAVPPDRFIVGPQNLIRRINDDALEAIFSNLKTPEQALEEAVSRANYLLLRFANNTAAP